MLRKFVYIMMALAGLSLFVQIPLLAAKLALPPTSQKTLTNELKVIIVENHEQPVVSLRLLFKSGTAFDPAGKAGLANLTADLLRKGTKSRDANKISEEIDFVGGSLGAGADLDATFATCEVLTKHLDIGLNLLADIILNPTFPDAEIERLRKQTIAGLIQQKDDPNSIVSDQYGLALFGKHPYGQPKSGTVESVTGITRQDIETFWRQFYIPNNAVLFIAGDVKPEAVVPKVESKFGGWQKGPVPTYDFPQADPVSSTKIILINKPDATQSNIKIGHLGINRYSPDIFACRVMNYILGGGGFVSRMMADIRAKRGLTYDINSQFSYNRFTGEFTVTTFTRSDSTARAIEAAIEHLNKIRSGDVTAEELSETQSFYSGYFPLQFETPNQVANQMSTVELYGLGNEYLPNYLDKIAAVTSQDIRRVAEKYISHDKLLIVVVGNGDVIREGLKKIAPVTELDLADL